MDMREGKKRTQVDDIDRSKYDFRFEDADAERLDAGLTFLDTSLGRLPL